MQIYYIRHAESANNALWVATGGVDGRDPDPDLTAIGRAQLPHLARCIGRPYTPVEPGLDFQNQNGFGLTHVYTSLMVRAVETGQAVAAAAGVPLVGLIDIHEFGGIFAYGENWSRHGLPGRTPAELAARFPDLILPADAPADGWWQSRHEELPDMAARARRVWDLFLDRHGATDDRVALIGHGGFFQAFMAAALKLPSPESWERGFPIGFSLNNAAVTRLTVEDGRTRLLYTNRADHLPAELITR